MQSSPLKPTDTDLLRGIRRRDNGLLTWIYRQYFPGIRTHVVRNSGTEEAAREVFQEAMLVMLEKTAAADFELSGKLYNYFYGICRFIWLRKLREKRTEAITSDEADTVVAEHEAERAETYRLRRLLYVKHFERLGSACQAVLRAFLAGEPMREVAARLNYTEDYARLKKYKCKEQLKKAIAADPDYREIMD